MVRIPDVRGRPYGDVAAELSALGLRPVRVTRPITEYYDMGEEQLDDVELGADAVLAAEPASGTDVESGSTVELATNPARNVDDPMGRHEPIPEEASAQRYVAAIQAELARLVPGRDEDVKASLAWAAEDSIVEISLPGGARHRFDLFGEDLDNDLRSPRPASYVATLIYREIA